jgi:60S ribosome subunit biogenesis protein NIP7
MKMATNFGREQLLALGTCVGKFTKTDRFMLSITFLDYLAQYAKVRIASLSIDWIL